MAAISTIIAGAGLALAGGSAIMNYNNSKNAAAANNAAQQAALEEQRRQEALRKQQADLDAMRRTRATMRTAIMAGAQAQTASVASGSQFGSLLPGAYAGIAGQAGRAALAISQNKELGDKMFDSNSRLTDIYSSAARASAEFAGNGAFWSGLGSLGGALMSNSNTIGKISTWVGNQFGSSNLDLMPNDI